MKPFREAVVETDKCCPLGKQPQYLIHLKPHRPLFKMQKRAISEQKHKRHFSACNTQLQPVLVPQPDPRHRIFPAVMATDPQTTPEGFLSAFSS